MIAYFAFLKKEFMEFTRTYKLLLLLSIFIFIGVISPLTAKLTPILLENLIPANIEIKFIDPTALDSWAQFYKNVSQIGFIILLILFSGLMSQEYSKGTLIHMLTKGLSRSTVILSKFTMATIMWSLSYLLSFILCLGYTIYFWPKASLNHIIFSAFCLWLYGILLISLIIFACVLFKSSYASLLFTFLFIGLQFLLNIIPQVSKYNPISLSTKNIELINGLVEKSDFIMPMAISSILCVLFLFISIYIFNKKAL